MDIFSYTTYKSFLIDYIRRNKYKGLITQLASACGCDRTYLSQAMAGKADLLPDHMIKLCEYLKMSELESDYLLNLLLKDRSTTLAARTLFENKLKKIKQQGDELSQKIKNKKDADEISEEYKTFYYSNWLFPAIHTLTSISDFQMQDAIAKKLNLPESQTLLILNSLIDMGLVVKSKNKYLHSGQSIYLKRDAAQIYSLHLQSRLESVKRSYEKNDIHFTNIFSVAKSEVDTLRGQIMELIETQRKTVHISGAEVACVFNCDFFVY
ncbi:MAG: DUF4423 domain-containing protein [Bdellovibrio sp.]